MSELNQLLLDFGHKKNFNDHDYYVSKSNFFAFNIIDKWPKWEKKILNICGDKFSGKTHLANVFKSKSKALLINCNKINDDIFKKIKLFESIIIDDFNDNLNEKLLYSISTLNRASDNVLSLNILFSHRWFQLVRHTPYRDPCLRMASDLQDIHIRLLMFA